MRQHTTPEQTAKLIEMGFEKPCSIASVEPIYGMGGISVAKAYSVGELVEMLPRVYIKCEIVYVLNIEAWDNHKGWDVQYFDGIDTIAHYTPANELIDALWVMIVKLKEEGVI